MPNELLSKVVFHCKTLDVLTNVAEVSNRFDQLSKLNKNITLDVNNNLSIEKSIRLLSSSNYLERLSIQSILKLSFKDDTLLIQERKPHLKCDQILLSLANLENIRVLDFTDIHNRCEVRLKRPILEILGRSSWWTKLTTLSIFLEESEAKDERTKKTLNSLATSGSIRYLNVGGLLLSEEKELIMACQDLEGVKFNQCFKQSEIRDQCYKTFYTCSVVILMFQVSAKLFSYYLSSQRNNSIVQIYSSARVKCLYH